MSYFRPLILLVCPAALFAQAGSAFGSLAADSTGHLYLTSPLILRTPKPQAAGTQIVYSYSSPSPPMQRTLVVRAIDVSTGGDTVVAEESAATFPVLSGPFGSSAQIWISDDGRQIVYLAAPVRDSLASQVFTVTSDGSGRRQLTDAAAYPEGFVETTISPNGATAYAISPWNRVVQIGISKGQVNEIVPRTPVVSASGYGGNGMVPGSIAVLYGTALSDGSAAAAPPLPLSLAGTGVQVAGRDAPIVSAEPGAVRFQVPFETALGPATITIKNLSPFEQDAALYFSSNYPITAWDLSFLDLAPDPSTGVWLSAIHQDFRSLVTLDNPAQPDEIVHFYAAGMGPVSPAVPTGQPAPSDPPARVVNPPQCSVGSPYSDGVPVAVRFAGLAPGLAGVYQLSLQLPSAFSLGPGQRYVVVFCELPGGDFVGGVSIAVPGGSV